MVDAGNPSFLRNARGLDEQEQPAEGAAVFTRPAGVALELTRLKMAARSVEDFAGRHVADVSSSRVDATSQGKLRQFADLARRAGDCQVVLGPASLQILPARKNGFPVLLQLESGVCIMWIGGLIQEFDDLDEAISLVRHIIDGQCRLKVERRRGKPCAWTLQMKKDDSVWVDSASSSYFRLLPAWIAGHATIDYHYMGPLLPQQA